MTKLYYKALKEYMKDKLIGDNNLQDGELELGDYVYRGVKIVPSSSDD